MSESRVGKRRSDDSETLTAVLWSGPVSASILFEGVLVGEGAHLRNCIIEKDVEIPPREQIGMELARDRERFIVSDQGIVVVPKGYRL